MADHSHSSHQPGEIPKPHTKEIWRTFWILAIITAFEFLIAFTMASSVLRVSIFVGMTLVKAFFIVAEFMHLKTEVKTLMYCIVIPLVFIVWLVIALLMEGNAILHSGY
ncbi:MAG: cytochrome C oxidase subunit IV family protein [Bacteroidota bacterium]